MGKSWSQTIMKDQRVTIDEAQIFAAPESVLTVTQALPGSVAVAEGATVGDVVVQEYTPEIQQTIGKLIESFTGTMSKTAETSLKVTEVLGEKLQETELGQAAILPGMAKYLLIAVVAIIIAGKVIKK